MKAIWLSRPGGPEVLEYREIPTPEPRPGQVLVKAHSIGVNMPEVLVRRGEYPHMPALPTVPGIEMSGEVVAVAPGVRALREGQPVYVSARELPQRAGCYAEYIAVDEHVPYMLPAGVDFEAAATLSAYQVAYHLLNSATRGHRYESVLVKAAGGGIGTALIQLGCAAGTQVIAAVRSDEKAEFVLDQGAAVAVNERTQDLEEQVTETTGGRGVDLVLDPVGGSAFAGNFDLLAPLGMVVLFGFLDGWPSEVLPAMRKHARYSPAMRVFNMHTFNDDRETRRTATEVLLQMLAEGVIRPVIQERVPLAEAARAQAMLENGRVLGQLLLSP